MDLLQQVWHNTSGGFRGVARGATAPFLKSQEVLKNECIDIKYNKTGKFLYLVPFLLFTKYNSIHPPMGCTHYTPYFIYIQIKLTSFENLINFP